MKKILFIFCALFFVDELNAQTKESDISPKLFGFIYDSINFTTIKYFPPKSPADKAGLKIGDKIIKINNTTIDQGNYIEYVKYLKSLGDKATFEILRNNETKTITITKEPKDNFSNKCISGNCVNGKGVYVFENYVTFDGEFKDSILVNGTLYFTDGDKYIGSLVNKKFDGYGEYYYRNGTIYKGYHLQGKRNGKGEFLKINGNKYKGDFANNKMEGKGLFTWQDGSTYEGDFSNDARNGYVVYKNDVMKYEGNWQNDKRHGIGKQADMKNGQITQVFDGEWEKGVFIIKANKAENVATKKSNNNEDDFDGFAKNAIALQNSMAGLKEEAEKAKNLNITKTDKYNFNFNFVKAYNYLTETAEATRTYLNFEELREVKEIKNEQDSFFEYTFTQILQPDFIFSFKALDGNDYFYSKEHPTHFIVKYEFEKSKHLNGQEKGFSYINLHSKIENEKVNITFLINKKNSRRSVDFRYAYLPAIPISKLKNESDKNILSLLMASARFNFNNFITEGKGVFMGGMGLTQQLVNEQLAADTVISSVRNYGMGHRIPKILNNDIIESVDIPISNHSIKFISKKMALPDAIAKAKEIVEDIKKITGPDSKVVYSKTCEKNCEFKAVFNFVSNLAINSPIITFNNDSQKEQIGQWFEIKVSVYEENKEAYINILID